jgi:hypothetical protein
VYIISANRVPGEDEMEDKDCGIYSLNRGLIKRARVEGQKEAEFPAASKQIALKRLNDESAQFTLKEVGGVEGELGVRARSRGVAEWLLDSSMKADDVEGRAQSSGNRGDVLRNIGFNIGAFGRRGVGMAVGRARTTDAKESSI